MKNHMIIVVGPSGAGKSSFVDKIVLEVPQLVDVITCTTRSMRRGESEGKPYFFLSVEEFKVRIKKDYFIEWAEVHGQYYGTPVDQIKKNWEQQKSVIMDLDVQGANFFRQKYPDEVSTIFILPPSIDELRQRVLRRDGLGVKDLDIRMKNAEKEIERALSFDHQITNDDFSKSYLQFKKIVEEILRKR